MKRTFLLYLGVLLFAPRAACNTPDLTIVIVIDQLTHRLLQKAKPYLKYGLRFLYDEGIRYEQAYVPYALPATGSGHATLNTGTLPKYHGIINNAWLNKEHKRVYCDESENPKYAVIGPNGSEAYAKSPENIMVDGISDQLVLNSQQDQQYQVFAISNKSRSAICTANKLAKAIWLDPKLGMFTSSHAYYQQLPDWITEFNSTHNVKNKSFTWKLAYPCLPAAYCFKYSHDTQENLIGKTFHLSNHNKSYKDFVKTPAANQLVFDLALTCIDKHMCKHNARKKLFLWVLPSALDKLGHSYGPESKETLDLLYHLDRQIQQFIDCVTTKVRKRNILWALTSDHGVCPIPEQVKEEGYTSARRITASDLQKTINECVKKTFDIENLVVHIEDHNVYINDLLFNTQSPEKQIAIKNAIVALLDAQPGIRKAWAFCDLQHLCFEKNSIESLFKNQLFTNRSGDFIIQTYPYAYITHHPSGTGHNSPYNYNRHIPLIIYQRGTYQRKTIHTQVYNTQLAPTLSYILHIPKPSACQTNMLPGIIPKDDPCF